MQWALIGAAFAAGVLLPLQNGLLTRVGEDLGQPILAALSATILGTLALLAYCAATRVPVPTGEALARVPVWAWAGGVLGAAYLTAAILMTPKLGVAALTASVIAGQVVASIALDHLGAFGLDVKPVNWSRAAGAALVVGGAILAQRS